MLCSQCFCKMERDVYNTKKITKNTQQKRNRWMVHWGAKCFVLRNRLWKFVNQLDWSPGTFKTTETFLIFAQYSFWQKTLNIRHSQGLHFEVQKDHSVLYKTTYTCIPKISTCPVWSNIGEISWHLLLGKKKCIKVGCLRPAVTFSLYFIFLSPKTDPCWIWQCH